MGGKTQKMLSRLGWGTRLWLAVLAAVATIFGFVSLFPDHKPQVIGSVLASWVVVVVVVTVRHFWARLAINPKKADELVHTALTLADVEYAIDYLDNKLREGGFIPDIIIGIDRGGAIVAGWLGKKLRLPSIHISLSDKWTVSSAIGSLDEGIKDPTKRNERYKTIQKVLVTDDASRTGVTLKRAVEYLDQLSPLKGADIKTAVILNEECKVGAAPKTPPDFYVYQTESTKITLPWDLRVLE